jgi:hypothetical protein
LQPKEWYENGISLESQPTIGSNAQITARTDSASITSQFK